MSDQDSKPITNPALIGFVTSIVMRGVAMLGGALIGANLLTSEQVEMIQNEAVIWLAGLVLAGLSMAYGLAHQYISRRKLLKAMAMPFAVTERDLEARIKTGGAPSITTQKDELPGPSTSPLKTEQGSETNKKA